MRPIRLFLLLAAGLLAGCAAAPIQGPPAASRIPDSAIPVHGTRYASLTLDDAGWVREAARYPSPNFDARPDGYSPSLIVIHDISLPPGHFGGDDVIRFFTNRLRAADAAYDADLSWERLSTHFFIRRDGQLIQFVSTDLRARHAGPSIWKGRSRVNDFSIGIELEGDDRESYTDAQYGTLDVLTETLCGRYAITGVAGHSDIAPGRKTDPGPHFDWDRYAREAGVGQLVGHAPLGIRQAQK